MTDTANSITMADLLDLAEDRGYCVGQIPDGANLAAGGLVLVVHHEMDDGELTVDLITAADLDGAGPLVMVDRADGTLCGIGMTVAAAREYILDHSGEFTGNGHSISAEDYRNGLGVEVIE
jgi:hypothetical protein